MKTGLILVGGGLANSLIAHRILIERPDFPLLVVERGASLGANHTWSFHDSDLTDGQRRWMEPLIASRWSSHELRFASSFSDRLDFVAGAYYFEQEYTMLQQSFGILFAYAAFQYHPGEGAGTAVHYRHFVGIKLDDDIVNG